MERKYKKKYGFDVYIGAVVVIGINLPAIIAKFKGIDVGISLQEACAAITTALITAYNFYRLQRQVNKAHRRVNAIVNPEGLSPLPEEK